MILLEKYFFEILVGLIFLISLLSTLIFFLAKRIQQQSSFAKESLKNTREKEKFILESLDIISKALIQEQCEVSEGCIRIRMLVDKSKMLDSSKKDYEVFFNMYQELKNFKTHEKRNELSKQEIMKEDIDRFKVEEKYQAKFLEAVQILHADVKELL
ncbi:MAG: hypothetical protein CES88_06365 [Halobacteriovorax sp. JY17]|nr:MAG: hypothetical protein CES88_06365 [Halobacteriovorax sp. JY17]